MMHQFSVNFLRTYHIHMSSCSFITLIKFHICLLPHLGEKNHQLLLVFKSCVVYGWNFGNRLYPWINSISFLLALDSTIVFCGGVISSTSSYIIIKTQFCYWCWNNNKFSCANSNWMVEFVNVADLHCERKFIQNFCASCSCAGVQNKVLNIDESIYIPVTRAEYTVLISAFNVRPLSLSLSLSLNCKHQKSRDSVELMW